MTNNSAQICWQPSHQQQSNSKIYGFIKEMSAKYQRDFNNYSDFYQWSVDYPKDFWREFLDFSAIQLDKDYNQVLQSADFFQNSRWFSGSELNFAKNLLDSQYNNSRLSTEPDYSALIAVNESGNIDNYSIGELKSKVFAVATLLRDHGVQPGDRVAGLLPNNAEAVIAMLATTSIGAVWTACSPDFGEQGILERFVQVSPKVLLVIDCYFYKGKKFDCHQKNVSVINALTDGLSLIITISDNNSIETQKLVKDIKNKQSIDWQSIKPFNHQQIQNFNYTSIGFNDPVYIMYSSGTTGQPKCIVHGAGGVLIEHFKEHLLHHDVKATDNFLYFTTTSWMMWHWQVSAIGLGASIILYDGAPNHPHSLSLIEHIEKYNITLFGASAKYFSSLEKAQLNPKSKYDLSSLRIIFSTGSPLVDEQYDYLYQRIKSDFALCSISGGTDILGCFALGNPLLPVHKGQLQCRSLGINVAFYDDNGNEVVNQKGDLVCLAPFPSMPLAFWNDKDGIKYKAAYFDKYNNIWRHGDYGKLTKEQGVIIFGRSDAVLNPGGVRIGTAEIYAVLEKIPDVTEGIAVGQQYNNDERIILFVVLQPGLQLDTNLRQTIAQKIKTEASPRHVPAIIIQVPELPRTTSGKLVELAVKNIIAGNEVKNINALANPQSLDYFKELQELQE